ncbi:hypothetical protein HPB50_029340 [Hyalomma asiaticum]|nr:hypothetical protein HPB50_029340 [Hyalomma asiaticum]
MSFLVDSTKLCLYNVSKRRTVPKEVLPKGVVVRVNAKNVMADDMVLEWYHLVWLLRPGASLMKDIPNLLVLDSFRGRLTAKVKAVQDLLCHGYDEWISMEKRELTQSGRVRRASLTSACGRSSLHGRLYHVPSWCEVKCGLTLDDYMLGDRSSYDGSSTNEDDSSDDE